MRAQAQISFGVDSSTLESQTCAHFLNLFSVFRAPEHTVGDNWGIPEILKKVTLISQFMVTLVSYSVTTCGMLPHGSARLSPPMDCPVIGLAATKAS
jgi:hypothetical protein